MAAAPPCAARRTAWWLGLLLVVLAVLLALPVHLGPSAAAGAPRSTFGPALPAGTAVRGPGVVPIAPPHAAVRGLVPLATGVNPYAFFSSEPTSLGVTDYGVDSAGNGYSYSTPIWWADANITRLLAYYPTETNGDGDVTLQLNVVLRLVSPSHTQYAFWAQDVVSVNTITKVLAYEDNVWNLSAGGSLASGSISGNGSTGTFGSQTFYADAPGCQGASGGYPGNCLTLHAPAIVTVRVTTGRFAGLPHVAFQYEYGGTWVTYDNVSFPFAGNYADNDFTVDGTQYTPYSLFYDAEWDYTGSSGGQTEDRNTSMAMQLERWNGHNLQAPPNAYNFGSNTGESIYNVIAAPEMGATNSTLGASVSTGAGTLQALYFSTDVATLNVSTPALANGVITIGGEPHAFVGQTAVFTLAPGSFNVSLWAGSQFVASAVPTLSAGRTTYLYLGYPQPYTVTFVEQGLPGTVTWSLTLDGIAYPNPGPSLAVELTNGSHNYTVAPVAGFTTPTYRDTFNVSGRPQTVFVNFTAFVLVVDFTESGLPSGASWTVTLGTLSQTALGPSIAFNEPNGTYPFTVNAGLSYLPSPSNSSVLVQGLPTLQTITFSLQPGYLTGSIAPTDAALIVGGSAQKTVNGTFNLSLLPGVYTVEVSATGYVTVWTNVSIAPATATPLGVVLNQSRAPPGTGSGNGGSSGITPSDTLLLVGAAAVIAAVVVGAALVANRRRRG